MLNLIATKHRTDVMVRCHIREWTQLIHVALSPQFPYSCNTWEYADVRLSPEILQSCSSTVES